MDIQVWSHVLATVKSAAVNIGVPVPLFEFGLDICPGAGLPDHVASLFSVFLRSLYTFFVMAASTYIPTTSVGGFPFLHTFSSIYGL